jgi:hypothetical protein
MLVALVLLVVPVVDTRTREMVLVEFVFVLHCWVRRVSNSLYFAFVGEFVASPKCAAVAICLVCNYSTSASTSSTRSTSSTSSTSTTSSTSSTTSISRASTSISTSTSSSAGSCCVCLAWRDTVLWVSPSPGQPNQRTKFFHAMRPKRNSLGADYFKNYMHA